MSRAANRTVLSGILTRILQSTSDDKLITMCILALQYEAQHYHLEDYLLKQVIAQAQFRAQERHREECRGGTGKS